MQRALQKFSVMFCLFLAVLWSLGIATVAVPVFLIHLRSGQKMQRAFGKVWLWLMGIEVKVVHPERLPGPSAGVLIASNHASAFDIFIIAALPIYFRWVSKIEVARIPAIGWSVWAMGSFFVRRDRSGHDLNVMREVEEGLKSGKNVVMFPEGTRTRTGQLLPFKKGAFRAAQNAQVPLLPIAIVGSYDIAPPHKLPLTRGHRVEVRVGELMKFAPDEGLPAAMERYRKALVQLIEEKGDHYVPG